MSKEKQINEITNELIFTKNYGTLDAVAKHLYESGYRKQEWISVDDKLPEKSGGYLVYTYNENRLILDYSAEHNLFNTFDSYSRDVAEGYAIPVTHWMPLPEPPKMKGGAE